MLGVELETEVIKMGREMKMWVAILTEIHKKGVGEKNMWDARETE